MTPVEYAHSIGFLDQNTVLAHQVHCSDHDLEILRDTGTKIVHNPLANTILGSGMPPIVKMLEMGIDVAISTMGPVALIVKISWLLLAWLRSIKRHCTEMPDCCQRKNYWR